MVTNKRKKVWVKPELIIIDRVYKEESVLLTCLSPSPATHPACPHVEQNYGG